MIGIFFAICAMITALPVVAQEQLDDIKMVASARDYNLRGEFVNISISPANPSIISFESIEGGNLHRLWWIDTRTNHLVQITPRDVNDDGLYWGARSDRNISWSPRKINGKNWFLFVSSGYDGRENIYLGNTDSEFYLRLTNSSFVDHHPRWSPDGKRFVYVSSRSGSGDIYLVDDVNDLISRFEREARKNPGSRELTIEGISSGVNHLRLTRNPEMDSFPDWSPDGRYIVYQGLHRDEGRLNIDLFLIDMHYIASDPVNLTQNPREDALQPRWSYDQKYIAYYASPAGSGSESPSTVSLSYAEVRNDNSTGKLSAIISGETVDNNIRRNNTAGPLWGPGSRSLLYVKGEGNYTPILMSSTVGSGPVSTEQILRRNRPDIIHREIAGRISTDGAIVAYLTYEDQDYRIYTARPAGGILARSPNDVYIQPVVRDARFHRTARTIGIGGQAVTFLNQKNPDLINVHAVHNLFLQFTVLPYIEREQPYEVSIRTSFGSIKPAYRTDGGESMRFSYKILDFGGVVSVPIDRVIDRTSIYIFAGIGMILGYEDINRPAISRRVNVPHGFGIQYSVTQFLDISGQFTFRNVQFRADGISGGYSTVRTRGVSFGLLFGM